MPVIGELTWVAPRDP
jgi:hypothetical protein